MANTPNASELIERLTPAGRKILDVAGDLFYRRGIQAVGVDTVAAEAGVTKKTLYACFSSKDQLVAAYLAERDARWRQWLTRWVEQRADTPRDKLLCTFDALGVWMRHRDFRGCGFVNALAEIPSAEHPARAVIWGQKQWMLEHFRMLAEAIGIAEPESFARTATLLYEGVTVSAATGMPEAAEQAREAMETLLAASSTASPA